jgi:cytochrome c5
MNKAIIISAGILVLAAGCGGESPQATAPTEPTGPVTAQSSTPAATLPAAENHAIEGAAAYDRVCAHCHEDGVAGAPRTGDAEAWTARSPLWEAVLFKHAQDGYLDMPAKGGDEDLADREVEAAAEYMLSITYPDRLPDAR